MNTFTKQHTNIFKGIATLLLLFHHLFYEIESFQNCFVWSEQWIKALNYIALNCKVCVALFLFLSGYGLVKSANGAKSEVTFKFSVLHIFKILIQLWFIYLLFVPLGFAFGRTFADIYGTGLSSVKFFLADLTGTSYLFGYLPKVNETWWFFGEIIRLYLIFPLFYSGIKKNSVLTLMICVCLEYCYGLIWFVPFVLGMIFAEKDLLSILMEQKNRKRVIGVLVNALLLLILIFLNLKYGILHYGVFSVVILAFFAPLIDPDQIIGKALAFIGTHSANIFMFHTFIYLKYMHDFIYGMKYPVLIFIVFTLICLIVSMLIEQLKKLIHYEKIGLFANASIEWFFEKCNYIIKKILVKISVRTS